MKTIILICAALVICSGVWAQDGDTTKIKLGDTKIIIIDKNKSPKENEEKMEQAKKEFEKMLAEKQKSLEEQKKMLEEQQKMLEKQQDELMKQEGEKKLQEMNKSVEDLNKEVQALEKGLKDLKKEKDDEFADDSDDDKDWKDRKFDWDFDKKWDGDWDNLSPFRHKGKFTGHWAGFNIGLNSYVTPDKEFTLDPINVGFELDGGHSWVFALNFMEFNIPFGKYVGITTGLGTSWNNYSFRNNVNFTKNIDGVMVATPEDVKDYSRNSIHTWNFTVPLILELQAPGRHNSGVYVGFGVYGTAKVKSWGTVEYKLDGVKYEEKRKSDFMMNNLRYGLTANVGLKYIKLFANYDLVPLFQKDRGPELYPVSIGLMILSF